MPYVSCDCWVCRSADMPDVSCTNITIVMMGPAYEDYEVPVAVFSEPRDAEAYIARRKGNHNSYFIVTLPLNVDTGKP